MASNDWRWYLFFIPLVLAFFAIVGLVFYTHRRRRILKARRSTLRNVTLVLEEDEKVKQRQEKLERMSSVRSNLSRMTSTKSTYSRSAIGRDVEREHRRLRATTSRNGGGRGRGGGENAQAEEKGLGSVQQDQIHVIGRDRDNHDVEADGVYDLSNQNRRKEMLSVIGESQGESSRISNAFNSEAEDPSLASVVASSSTPSKPSNANGKSVSNHDLQAIPSTSSGGGERGGDPFITPITASSQTNPFASPQNSSSDHDNPSSSIPIPIPPPTSQPNKNGLARKLSEVVRLKSPIPPRSTPSNSSEKDRVSPTVAKVSTDTFGVKSNTRPSGSGSGSGSQPEASQNQLSLPLNNGRTSTSSSRSAVTTQMIGAPSSPNIVASPIRSNSIDASTATNTNTNTNPVGGSEWTYVSRADQWRKPGRKSLETSNHDGRDYLNKDPNPLGLSNVSLSKKSPSLKAQSATHLPLPKQNRNDSNDGSGLKRAVSIGAAGSKFKETFDDSP